MAWATIFDGYVMGDHITVEWDEDDEEQSEYPIKVTATVKLPPKMLDPIVEPGSIVIPPPPDDPAKRYIFEYDSIDDMYEDFANDTGRSAAFMDELEKSISNY